MRLFPSGFFLGLSYFSKNGSKTGNYKYLKNILVFGSNLEWYNILQNEKYRFQFVPCMLFEESAIFSPLAQITP